MKEKNIQHPEKITSYFKAEAKLLSIVTISGVIYNVGLAAWPYFTGQLLQGLYDFLRHEQTKKVLLLLALTYVIVVIIVQSMRAIKRLSVRIFANRISRTMRRLLYHDLLYEDHHDEAGDVMMKAIGDVDACVEGMRKFTTEIFDTGVVMFAYLVMLIHYDWRLTILACLFTPFAYFLAGKLKKQVTKASRAYKESGAQLNTETLDRLDHALLYRINGVESIRNDLYERRLSDYEHKSVIANIYEGALTPIYDAIAMIGTIMIFYFGGRNVLHFGWSTWNIAAFTTYLSCFTALATKASHAAKLFNAVQKATVSWQRIQPFMKRVDVSSKAFDPLKKVSVATNQAEVYYPNHPETTVELDPMHFQSGELIGITGIVACGKSLLGKVFVNEASYNGSIRINDQELKDLSDHERHELISYMGHDPELLSASIYDNIALGEEIDVEHYLKLVEMDQEVAKMSDGTLTMIGHGGMSLSGGQQDRIALARTLAHARSVLILDDPFSAVDQTTEAKILHNIQNEFSDRLILIMSHRLTHFSKCDQVIFIDDGEAICKSPDHLLMSNIAYMELYASQMKGSEDHD